MGPCEPTQPHPNLDRHRRPPRRVMASTRSYPPRASGPRRQLASSSRSQLETRAIRVALLLTWQVSSIGVRWRPSLTAAIVTHLVTRSTPRMLAIPAALDSVYGEATEAHPEHSEDSSDGRQRHHVRLAQRAFRNGSTGSHRLIRLAGLVDWLLRRSFRPRPLPASGLIRWHVGTPPAAAGYRDFPPVLARSWHVPTLDSYRDVGTITQNWPAAMASQGRVRDAVATVGCSDEPLFCSTVGGEQT